MKLGKISLFMLLLTFGCGLDDDEPQLSLVAREFDFNSGLQDWVAGFADYPANPEDSSAFELTFSYTDAVDSKLGKRSVMLSGKNVNRDLFLYIKKKVNGLQPNTDYTLTFQVELATDLQMMLQKVGGIYLKAGAIHTEPKTVIDGGNCILNLDKGNSSDPGEDMITLGDLLEDGKGSAYSLVTRSNTTANSRYVARTNSNGEIWLIVGADSSIEGTTKLFFTRIAVLFSVS